MPRQINLSDELTKVEKQLEADPTYKFAVISRIVTPTYLELIKDAIDKHQVLSHAIEDAVRGYYEQKGCTSLDLDESAKSIMEALAGLWNCDTPTAIRNLIQRSAVGVLKEEVALRNDVSALLKEAKGAAKATTKGKSTPTS